MKKVKITLRPESHGRKLYLFPTAEALHVWLCSLERGEPMTMPGINEVLLRPGSFAEAELRGYEYAYANDGSNRRVDLVLLGLAQRARNGGNLVVSQHLGWVSSGLLPMRRYSDVDLVVVPITEETSRLTLVTSLHDQLT